MIPRIEKQNVIAFILKGGDLVFNLPAETFWLIFPWPFIWLGLGIFMYFRKKRDDKLEEEYDSKTDGKEMK